MRTKNRRVVKWLNRLHRAGLRSANRYMDVLVIFSYEGGVYRRVGRIIVDADLLAVIQCRGRLDRVKEV